MGGIVGKRRASTGATGDGYGLTYTPNGAQFGTGPWDANGELTYYDPSNGQHTDLNATYGTWFTRMMALRNAFSSTANLSNPEIAAATRLPIPSP